ncbi:hypothetical protein [Streptomyces rochei]|uniref:hypothetical protein n=1 Tax=Streptomyces rochei TaxID=1928 RepID=UPI00346652C2
MKAGESPEAVGSGRKARTAAPIPLSAPAGRHQQLVPAGLPEPLPPQGRVSSAPWRSAPEGKPALGSFRLGVSPGRPDRLHPRPVRVHRGTGHHRRRPHRDIAQALPPQFADRLLTAKERGATEQQLQQLQQVATEGLAQMYFRANSTRVHGLGVEFTDVEHIEIEL